jgi:glucan biosynthesis protein C
MEVQVAQVAVAPTATRAASTTRLYYLDWLRVIAIFGVFLFHAVHPFDYNDWHIKNAELSMAVTVVLGLLFPWGLPFFFMISGSGSWFALRRRSAEQYMGERFRRLMIPYITGVILLWPFMLYVQWRHLAVSGKWYGPFLDFVLVHRAGFSPMWFGEVGFHLWFLGFLFCFSLLALPIFLWLKWPRGQALIGHVARICEGRGAILLLALPVVVVRLALQPFFPQEHDWADFFTQMTFFVLGFVLYTHEAFARVIRRDWKILLGAAIASSAGWAYLALTTENLNVEAPITSFAINGWCWSTFMLSVGMRSLNFTNRNLEYLQAAILPFFVLHQPVIMAVAFFVVQWPYSIAVKLVTVVIASLVVTLAIYEFVIRRIGFLRPLFGMKA